MVVGYHADASALAPKGWLTGSEWDWGDLYTDIVEDVARRQVHRRQVQRQLPGRLQGRREPVRPVEVRPDGRRRHQGADRRRRRSGSRRRGSPFDGPGRTPRTARSWSPPARSPDYARSRRRTRPVRQGRRRRASPRADGPRRPTLRPTDHVADTIPYPWPYDGDARTAPQHSPSWSCGAQPPASVDVAVDGPAPCSTVLGRARRRRSGDRSACRVVVGAPRHGTTCADPSAYPPGRGAARTGSWPSRPTPPTSSSTPPGSTAASPVRPRRTRCAPAGIDRSLLGGLASELTVDSTMRDAQRPRLRVPRAHRRCAPLDADARRPRPPQPDHVRRHLRCPRHHRRPDSPAVRRPDPRDSRIDRRP